MNSIANTSLLLGLFAFLFYSGCDGKVGIGNRYVPVPLTQQAPFSYQGRIGRIWGGDGFEVISQEKVHFVYLRGIDGPTHGQFARDLAEAKTRSLAKGKQVTIEVIERDVSMREVADVKIPLDNPDESVDLALALLESGLAWFDRSEGPYRDSYLAAETSAREKKIGIWSQKDPVPPWKAWEQLQQEMKESLGEGTAAE